MSFVGVIVNLFFLGTGCVLLWGSVTGAPWWMVADTRGWAYDSRKFIKKVFGDRVLRIYGIVVGAMMIVLSLYAWVSWFARR
jgi:hypothetical protein